MKTSIMFIMGPAQDAEAIAKVNEVLFPLGYEIKEMDMRFAAIARIPHIYAVVYEKKHDHPEHKDNQ